MKLTRLTFEYQSDYIDSVMENPSSYTAQEIYELVYMFPFYKKKLLDALLIKCSKEGTVQSFVDNLIQDGLYEEYVESVKKSKNEFMKIFFAIFINDKRMQEYLSDEKKAMQIIVNNDEYHVSTKVFALSGLTTKDIKDETVEEIKKYAISMIKSDKDINKEYKKEELDILLETVEKGIDENHKDAKKRYALNKGE